MPTVMDTYIENRQRVQPNHANVYDTVHGGNVMKWMDEYGAMSAMRLAGEACVTATVRDLDFERPVPVGDIVVVESYVYDTGRTSVRTRVKAARENPRTGERRPTTDSTLVYVAVDADGRPTEVPDLTVEGERGRALRDAAVERENGA